METGALQSIISACVRVCVFVCVRLCGLSVCFELRDVCPFFASCLFFLRVSVFVARVCVLCLRPCLAPFHKHLVDSVIFSAVFTSPTRHLGVLLVNCHARALPHVHTHIRTHVSQNLINTADTLKAVSWQSTGSETATFNSLTKHGN